MRQPVPRPFVWSLCAAWAGVIFFVSSRTGDSLPGGFSIQGHVIEYFVLGALLTWALSDEGVKPSAIVLAVLLASLYGITDEIHQHFVPGRTPDAMDWLLDTLGATAGAFFARALILRAARKRALAEETATD